uniref:Beta-hexosaminidase (Beta-N-acetylhexosaminidase) (N-acetyl-beta-glucosaminidase)) n=1 Tax=Ganoderma boninense TaxID=34458 RepID=A0A5K1K3S8_9APHY|nr:Beta-hexosaminidase (EC (Beta-GlcNAcase) (Beta-N-acetylhexosaminidase) (N-acetyl-beta-glucosaminidase) [Ganoderma boninense]
MPDHNVPRNFEFEREQPWGGGAVVNDADTPVSFLFRGPIPRRSPTADAEPATDPVGEEVGVEPPRGLPPPRLKTPPPRQYRAKPSTHSFTYDPADIVEMFGFRWVTTDEGDIRRLDVEDLPTTRMPMPKRALAEPIPGVSKPSRGRHVPTKETAGPNRKHICTVEGCGKMFTKRAHLSRHIASLHRHERTWSCFAPYCDKNFTRYDNYLRHQSLHSHYQEIFQCAPADEYKGVHVQNPNAMNPSSFNIKPFAAIAIHPTALNLWRFQETQRMNGVDLPRVSDCDKYFAAHPEQREAALRGDPEWEWRLPQPGADFRPIDARCLEGTFRVDVKSQDTPEN